MIQDLVQSLNTIFSDSPAFMTFISLPDFRYEMSNEQHNRLLGRSDVVGKTVMELLPELEAQGFMQLLRDVAETGKPFIGSETPVTFVNQETKLSRLVYLDFVYQSVRRPDGKIYGIACEGYEVTEKVVSRKAIENERENFRNLFRQSHEMVCITKGPNHIFEFVNEAHIKALGFDATGMPVRMAQPESVEVHGLLDSVYRSGKTIKLYEIPVTLTDRLRYFTLTYAARRDELGLINGIMILGVEVTDQVLARDRLKQNQLKLDMALKETEALLIQRKINEDSIMKALKIRDEFLSIASHELKTPITSLKMQLQMTQRKIKPNENIAPDPARLESVIANSMKQVNRLADLVEDLLDVTKIEAGKLSYNFEKIDLRDIINGVVQNFTDSIVAANCTIKIMAPVSVFIKCDRFRLEQVFENLLSNALKYGAGKPIELTITENDQFGRLEIRDHGIGIEFEKQNMIFERFGRAVNGKQFSGLGLGLYIVKHIVEAHDGHIYLESAQKKGSRFTIEIPKHI